MIQNYQKAMNSGKFDNGVTKKGDAGWKADTVAKATNYMSAADRASTKYAQRAQEMHAVLTEVQSAVESMPRGSLEERINRMVANARGIKEAWERRSG
jgi:hypothetical protein